MPEEREYLTILIESLEKKSGLLDEIILQNAAQTHIINQEKLDQEAFDDTIERKAELIRRMERLDAGFESIYARIKDALGQHRELYAPQISRLQKLITEVTDKSVRIQAAENRNKQLVEKSFSILHKDLRQSKVSNRVAAKYYNSMKTVTMPGVSDMDRKK